MSQGSCRGGLGRLAAATAAVLVAVSCGTASPRAVELDRVRAVMMGTNEQEMSAFEQGVIADEIVSCMKAEGFTYFREEGVELEVVSTVTEEQLDQLALGLSTTLFEQGDLPQGLVGSEIRGRERERTGAYFEALGVDGVDDYYQALSGNDATGGCIGQALRASRTGIGVVLTLDIGYETVLSRVMADPDYIRWEREAGDCLANLGYGNDPDAAVAEIAEAAEAIASTVAYDENGVDLDPSQLEQLASLQSKEFALTEALTSCQLVGPGRTAALSPLLSKHADALIAENENEIRAILE